MCGICGFMTREPKDDSLIEEMNITMKHRGPDKQKCVRFESNGRFYALGHCRLAVIDTTDMGAQPMFSDDKRYCIVFNGEIYNYLSLRNELQEFGYHFRTGSDTEVLLYSYIRWGEKALDKISGMFSFAVVNLNENVIFCARDRFGKKPLYYYLTDDVFAFSSELKPLFKFLGTGYRVNTDMLGFYFRFGYIPEPNSIIKEIEKLNSGSYMIIMENERGGIEKRITNYWSPIVKAQNALANQIKNYEEAKHLIENEIEKAVEIRLISDVPLGVYLSSGIDSSVVAYFAQKATTLGIDTFTIGFSDTRYNEADISRKISEHLGARHHEYYMTEKDMFNLVDRIPLFFDEPFGDTSMLPSMLLAQFAKESITVALSGDGGDEVFGGYLHYHRVAEAQKYARIGNFLNLILPDSAIDKFPSSVRRVLQNTNPNLYSQIILNEEFDNIKSILYKDYQTPYYEYETEMGIDDWQLRRIVLDMKTTLPGDMLHKVDRASMSASLEVRSPLLDHKVVEASFRIPMKYKIRGKTGKYILRDIAFDHIPSELIDRPKRGFSVPYQKWLRQKYKTQMTDLADQAYIKSQGIFVCEGIQRLLKAFFEGDDSLGDICWNFFVFQMWYERYVR